MAEPAVGIPLNPVAMTPDFEFTEQYRRLAEFRFRIRQFLRFSENAARQAGIEPQQYQLLLAIKGLPAGSRPTIRTISRRLCLRHNSTVELINRLAKTGAVERKQCEQDHREVLIELTEHGERLLQQLALQHLEELRNTGPELTNSLRCILEGHADCA